MQWRIDKQRSRIGFSVRHMLVATVHGAFHDYGGTFELDLEDFTRSRFAGEIDVASVDTGNRERDAELRHNQFFALASHPKISFASERIEPRGRGLYRVSGGLEVRGVRRPVTLEVELGAPKRSGDEIRVRLTARGLVNRKDFAVTMGPLLETGGLAVGDKVKLELDIEAVATA